MCLRVLSAFSLITFFMTSAIAAPDWSKQIFEEIESVYLPAQSALGLNLKIKIDQTSVAEYAKAERAGTDAVVTIAAPILHNPRLSADGLRMIICHELGHVFGGSPRRNVPMEWEGPTAPDGLSEASSEGQADYYASLICFRRVVAGGNHASQLALKPIGPRIKNLCDTSHGKNTEESSICQRAALAAENMLQLTKDFPISLELASDIKSPQLVRNSYPERQCRLDTFVSGALCKAAKQTDKSGLALDFNNAAVNECTQSEAQRPPCWYR